MVSRSFFYPNSRMKKDRLFLSVICFFMFCTSSLAYSGYVGDYIDLSVSTPSSDIYSIDWKEWSGSVDCVTLTANWGNDATVHIDSYFTGTVRIRAQYKTMSNAVKTEFFDITCNAVTLNVSPKSMSLGNIGDSEAITYTTSPSNKWPTVTYSSKNTSVATVSYAGVVKATGKGSTTITVSNSMGPDETVSVSVASGGGGGGDDPDPDPTIHDGDYFQDYTAEGELMLFIAGTFWGEIGCYVVPTKYGGSCVATANGRITIPSRPKGIPVRVVQNFAFHDLSGLTELVIPSTVTGIEVNCVYNCNNLRIVICEATTPPSASYVGTPLFDYSTLNNGTLFVPKGCKSKYEAAKGWKDFKNISEDDPSSVGSIFVDRIDDCSVYNLSGQRLLHPMKGINIIGGKKVIVK